MILFPSNNVTQKYKILCDEERHSSSFELEYPREWDLAGILLDLTDRGYLTRTDHDHPQMLHITCPQCRKEKP